MRTAPVTRRDNDLMSRLQTVPFEPVTLSAAERADEGCVLLAQGVECGVLASWRVGMRGDHICSEIRFVGAEQGQPPSRPDTLSSSDPADRDFPALARAHAMRLSEILGFALVPPADSIDYFE